MFSNICSFLPIFISLPSIVVGFKVDYPELWNINDTEESKIKTINDYDCDTQLNIFSEAFSTREEWALRLFDTWGKFQSGIFEKNQYSYGHFTDCLSFQYDLQSPGDQTIQGQYCLMALRATETIGISEENMKFFDFREIANLVRNRSLILYNGICLPASCSSQKIIEFTNKVYQQADLVSFEARFCQVGGNQFDGILLLPIIICSLFASTVYDLVARRKKIVPNELFISFSVYTNGKNLFDVTKDKSPRAINCVLGLRSISLLWIIYGHRFILQLYLPITNSTEVEGHSNRIYQVIVDSYDMAVDTFLTMGGLLITISTLKTLDKRSLNIPKMILHRYIRYTPVLAVVVLYTIFFMKLVSDGPYVPDMTVNRCVKYWWSALLHVQNYVNPTERCLDHTWYLSADFQLFIISPFLIYPAWKYGWKYLWSLVAFAVLSSIYVLTMCLVYGITVYGKSVSTEENNFYAKFIYQPTHARIGPWLAGIILGYVLHDSRNRNIPIGWKLSSALWILSISIIVMVVGGIHPLLQPSNEISLLVNAIYIAFHRLVWACAICWIIFACQKLKTGGFVRWFLSLPEWQPIARLSLSMYLVHYPYQITRITNQKQATTYEAWTILHLYLGDILGISIISTILYLTFEVPLSLVEIVYYPVCGRSNSLFKGAFCDTSRAYRG